MASRPQPNNPFSQPDNGGKASAAMDVELLKVMVSREGKKVSAQWGLHPQIKHDLLPDELRELTDIMSTVTTLVGTRFAEILASADPDQPSTA